ncbi:MAG: hypothetical protein ACREQH_12755 [Candidatus Binatus sp.]
MIHKNEIIPRRFEATTGKVSGLDADSSSAGAGGAIVPNNATDGPKLQAEIEVANRHEIHRWERAYHSTKR